MRVGARQWRKPLGRRKGLNISTSVGFTKLFDLTTVCIQHVCTYVFIRAKYILVYLGKIALQAKFFLSQITSPIVKSSPAT